MSNEEQARVFASNLNYYLDLNGMTQVEAAEKIGVSQQRFNTWAQGKAYPRMDMIQKLADLFGIQKSNLIDVPQNVHDNEYYLDPETARKAQEIFSDKDLRILFDAARGSRPEDLQMAADLLKRLKETNPDG